MHLASEQFKKIQNGTKTVEARLFDEKRRSLHVGDTIEFTDVNAPGKKITVRIVALHLFPSFSKLFNGFPMNSFGEKSKEDFLAIVGKFYSKDDEEKYGVLGIEIKLL